VGALALVCPIVRIDVHSASLNCAVSPFFSIAHIGTIIAREAHVFV
jgi:hypothetical protein